MANRLVAMIPELGDIFQGLDYDVVLGEQSSHGSTITDLPVDDPEKSFINDMNRDKPVILRATILVSTIAITPSLSTVVEPERLSSLYDKLLLLKREQVTNPDKLLTVQTGVISFRNMAISEINAHRVKKTSQGQAFDLVLRELRFAKSPVKFEAETTTLAAGTGAVSGQNERVAEEQDRPVLEGTNKNANRSTEPVTSEDQSILYGVFN